MDSQDFPGGSVAKDPHSNAGHMSLIAGRGTKIPHATGQLSWHNATIEPACHNKESTLCNERSHMQQPRSHAPQLRPDAGK